MATINEANGDFSSVDLKCSQCDKYLSVSPIYLHTDRDGNEKNICGRCRIPEDGNSIRNILFESLAKCMKFPCSISKDCQEKLVWGEAETHETDCQYREMLCTTCSLRYPKANVESHFMEEHKEKLRNNSIHLNLYRSDLPKNTTYLVVCPEISCLVRLKFDLYKVELAVKPIFVTLIQHFFSVTLSVRECMKFIKNICIESKNSPLAWEEHVFDIRSFLNNKTYRSSGYRIELEIHEKYKPDNKV